MNYNTQQRSAFTDWMGKQRGGQGFTGDQFQQYQANPNQFINQSGWQPSAPAPAPAGNVPPPPPPPPPPMSQQQPPAPTGGVPSYTSFQQALTKPTGSTDTSIGPTHLGSMLGVEDPGGGGVNVDPSVWDFFKQQGYNEQQMRNMLNGMGQPTYQDLNLQPRTGNNLYGPPNSITSRDPFFGRGRGAGGNSDPIFNDPEYGDNPFEGLPDDPNGNGGLGRNPLRNPGQWIDGQWVPDNPRQQPTNDVTFDQIGDMNGDGRVDLNDFLAYRTQQTTDTREGGGDNPGTPMRQDPTRRTATATQNPSLQQPGGQGGGNSGGLNYNGIDITDMNGDGKVDLNDFVAFRNRLTPGGNGGGQQPGGNGGGLPGQDAPGFGLDDILNGFQQALPGWMGTLLDRYQQGGQGGSGGQGGTSTSSSAGGAGGQGGSASVGDINLQMPTDGLDEIERLLRDQGQNQLGPDALQLILGASLGGLEGQLGDINQQIGGLGNLQNLDTLIGERQSIGDILGGLMSGDIAGGGAFKQDLEEPAIYQTLEDRLQGILKDDPFKATSDLELADLGEQQERSKNQQLEELNRLGILRGGDTAGVLGDLGEAQNRERLQLQGNQEARRDRAVEQALGLGSGQGGFRLGSGDLGLTGQIQGGRQSLDKLLGIGDLGIREKEGTNRNMLLEAELGLQRQRLGLDEQKRKDDLIGDILKGGKDVVKWLWDR